MSYLDSVIKHYRNGIRRSHSSATSTEPCDPAGSDMGFGADRDPTRLVFFSDAVFAIAVTLLVLEIRPPQDTRHLLHGLVALWPSYMTYAMTFLLIGWQPFCSMPSGTMHGLVNDCSEPPSTPQAPELSADASVSP
jgi:Endosomal/lysosomal potassium channel TMEM175